MHDDTRIGATSQLERERLERIRAERHALAGHTCALYTNARLERIDPALQDGIGCTLCYPPDGRVRGDDSRPMHQRTPERTPDDVTHTAWGKLEQYYPQVQALFDVWCKNCGAANIEIGQTFDWKINSVVVLLSLRCSACKSFALLWNGAFLAIAFHSLRRDQP